MSGNECHVILIGKRKHAVMKECIQAKGCDGGRIEGKRRDDMLGCGFIGNVEERYMFFY